MIHFVQVNPHVVTQIDLHVVWIRRQGYHAAASRRTRGLSVFDRENSVIARFGAYFIRPVVSNERAGWLSISRSFNRPLEQRKCVSLTLSAWMRRGDLLGNLPQPPGRANGLLTRCCAVKNSSRKKF